MKKENDHLIYTINDYEKCKQEHEKEILKRRMDWCGYTTGLMKGRTGVQKWRMEKDTLKMKRAEMLNAVCGKKDLTQRALII